MGCSQSQFVPEEVVAAANRSSAKTRVTSGSTGTLQCVKEGVPLEVEADKMKADTEHNTEIYKNQLIANAVFHVRLH
jgi:hypothetical protein